MVKQLTSKSKNNLFRPIGQIIIFVPFFCSELLHCIKRRRISDGFETIENHPLPTGCCRRFKQLVAQGIHLFSFCFFNDCLQQQLLLLRHLVTLWRIEELCHKGIKHSGVNRSNKKTERLFPPVITKIRNKRIQILIRTVFLELNSGEIFTE